MRRKIRLRDFDKFLFFAPIAIFMIGIVSIYSASFKAQGPHDDLALRQVMWMGIGVLLVFLILRMDYYKLADFAGPLYVLSLFLLVAVLFAPARLGAHRWLGFSQFNIQPSEIAKFAVILVLARYFSSHRPERISKRDLLVPLLLVGVPFLLILKEPDLGTGLTLIPVFFAMLYLWGMSPRVLAVLIGIGLLASPFCIAFLREYQRTRLLVFLNPNLDPLGAGYTIIQSKIAIGSGGLWGKGFLGGTQNALQFLPEKHTDFIFGVIAEEGGLVLSTAMLVLFWLIVKKGYVIAGQTPDRFGSQLACGFSTLIGIQAIVNLGMTMGLLPVVGIPLPLVSYGGTSIVVTMVAIAVLLNIKLYRPLF